MYDPPSYVWAISIAEAIAFPAATCAVLYGGAMRAGLGRRRAALLAGGAAIVLGGWFAATAVIAGHGWYRTRLGHGVPWMPVAVVGFLGLLLALRRIPVVSRALTAPGMVSRLELPHLFRVAVRRLNRPMCHPLPPAQQCGRHDPRRTEERDDKQQRVTVSRDRISP
jgi:hypothetical protein